MTDRALDRFRQMLKGEIPPPPMVELLGFRMTELEEGRVVFTAEPSAVFYNGMGVVHGGFAAALLDSALGCAINSTAPAGTIFTTIEMKINFTRPLTSAIGPISCEGRVVHAGSRVATAEGRIVDGGGKLYAHGTATCIVRDPSPSG